MFVKIRLCELSLTQPYKVSVCAKSLALVIFRGPGGVEIFKVLYVNLQWAPPSLAGSSKQLILDTDASKCSERT